MRPWMPRMAAALALVLLSGCAWLRPARGVKTCRYDFTALNFTGFGGGSTDWRLDLSVVNPNPHPVTLQRMRFVLVHEKDTLLTGWNPETRVLAPGDSQAFQVPLQLPNAVWNRLPKDLLSNTDVRFEIIGDAYLDTWLGEMRYPGALHQVIHVNVPQQIARYRDLMLERFFSPPRPRDTLPQDPRPPQDDTL